MWIATSTVSYIFFDPQTSPAHQDHIIAHEFAHVLAGHRGSSTLPTPDAGGLLNLLDPALIRAVLGRTDYAHHDEQEAEMVASFLQEHANSYHPPTRSALGRPVGQWLTNCRRPGGLGADPERAERRARELAEIDEDWNPGWPADWQRLYVGVRALLADGATLAGIVPGVTVRGEDTGRWLTRQREHTVWAKLQDGQRDKLTGIGVEPMPAPAPQKPAKAAHSASGAFGRGIGRPTPVQGTHGVGDRPSGAR